MHIKLLVNNASCQSSCQSSCKLSHSNLQFPCNLRSAHGIPSKLLIKLQESNATCQEGNATCQEGNATCQEGNTTCQESNATCQESNAACQESNAACQESNATCHRRARACIRIRMQTKQKIPDFNARRCKSATIRECGRVGWKVRTPAAGGLNRRGLDTPRMRVIMIRAIFLIFSRGIGRCIAAARLGTRQMRRCALELRGVGVS